MATWVWILIAIAAALVVALTEVASRLRRTTVLRHRISPEYHRPFQTQDGGQAAQADLSQDIIESR